MIKQRLIRIILVKLILIKNNTDETKTDSINIVLTYTDKINSDSTNMYKHLS